MSTIDLYRFAMAEMTTMSRAKSAAERVGPVVEIKGKDVLVLESKQLRNNTFLADASKLLFLASPIAESGDLQYKARTSIHFLRISGGIFAVRQ